MRRARSLGMTGARVMIVEDEAIVAMCLERTVRSMGHEVRCIVDKGEDAVERMESGGDIDVILMDIRLKGSMDGIEAATEIVRRKPLPIIFLSAYNDSSTMERARAVNPVAFLAKPVDETVLEKALKSA